MSEGRRDRELLASYAHKHFPIHRERIEPWRHLVQVRDKKIKRKVPVLYPNKLNLGIGETCYKPVGFMHFYSYSYAFVKSMTKTVSALLLTVCHH